MSPKRVGPEDPPDDENLGMFAEPPKPRPPISPLLVIADIIATGDSPYLRKYLESGGDVAAALSAGGESAPRPYLDASGAPPVLGDTFSEALDGERLGAQYGRIVAFMSDGAWRTLQEISVATGDPEASASARLRDMRRGGYTVERRRRGPTSGLWEYSARKNPRFSS